MTYERTRRNSLLLWTLVLISATYLAWQYNWPAYTGDDSLDGIVGIVLGLFICSRPAANGIDLLFTERGALSQLVSTAEGLVWFLLNSLVMLMGWFVISIGASRLNHGIW